MIRKSRGVGEESERVGESGKSREESGSRSWGGVRESNPPSWLGKPEHYHYANPARRQVYSGPFKFSSQRYTVTFLRIAIVGGMTLA